MKRRSFLETVGTAGLAVGVTPAWSVRYAANLQGPHSATSGAKKGLEESSPETILLKDYRPKSLYKIPTTEISKAKFPIIDMHSHAYAKTPEELAEWVRNMDEVGIEKTIVLLTLRGRDLTISVGSMPPIPNVSNSGAVLITRGMTNPDSVLKQYGLWKSAIRQAPGVLVNFMTREKDLFRALSVHLACTRTMLAWTPCFNDAANWECR